MKSIITSIVFAILFAIAGSVFWNAGKAETRLADAHRQLAMLQYADATSESADATMPSAIARVRRLAGDAANDAREVRTTAQYWSGAYADLQPQRDAAGTITETDPDVLLLSADASFRASQNETDRNAALRRLDAVVKNYAEVLKSAPGRGDAAYNYEYAVRVRDMLQKARPNAKVPPGTIAKSADDADLPAGPTLHGKPGGPPPKTDMAQFKIVIPKRGEERKDDPQAGKGGTKVRKG